MRRRPFIAGNWKMHKTPAEAQALAAEVKQELAGCNQADVALCPTFVCLPAVAEVLQGSPIALGAQNLFWEKAGAYTGEISAEMLLACGCRHVIVGHSERRQYFGETDATVNRRLKAALAAKLEPIVCLGETLDERKREATKQVLRTQFAGAFAGLSAQDLATATIAYEPVWAIGTGVNATPQQAQEAQAYIRALIREQFGEDSAGRMRIQYGGSVKPSNARELLAQPDVDGALVGGASLAARDFAGIVKAAP